MYLGWGWLRILDGSKFGGIKCLDVKTGALRWGFESNGFFTTPSCVDGTVYPSSSDGKVYALDANSGTVKWVFHSGSEFSDESHPTVAYGMVFVASPNWGEKNSRLYALEARTGELRWEFLGSPGYAFSPVVYKKIVFFCAGRLYALDAATGAVKWTYNLEQEYPNLITASVANGVVYARWPKNIVAIDANTGSPKWNIETFGWNYYAPAPAIAYGNLYYIDAGGREVVCLDASTGHKRWGYHIRSTYHGSVAVANGCVVAGAAHSPWDDRSSNGLYVLDAVTGVCLWEYETSPSGWADSPLLPTVSGDMFFFNVDGDIFTAFGPIPTLEFPDIPTGYISGDSHVHSEYSGDTLGFGQSISELVAEAKRQNLDWIIVTDHNDVIVHDIPIKILTREEWNSQQSDIEKISDFPVIQGEEVSMRDARDTKSQGHFLAYGIYDLVPSLYNAPSAIGQEALLAIVEAQKGFGFIAHPYSFGTPIIDADPWRDWTLVSRFPGVIKGLELLTDYHSPSEKTLEVWEKFLRKGKGRHLNAIGNTDYHNYPSLLPGSVLGRARNIIKTPLGLDSSDQKKYVLGALKNGASVVTNGPFLDVSIEGVDARPGEEVNAFKGLPLTLDFSWGMAPFSEGKIELFDRAGRCIDSLSLPSLEGQGSYTYYVEADDLIRVVLTQYYHGIIKSYAFSNPIWINVPGVKSWPEGFISDIYTGSTTLFAGQTVTIPFTVTWDMLQITFSINWVGSDVKLTLVDPEGQEITSDFALADYDIAHQKTDTSELFTIDNPEVGEWQLKITGVDVSPEGEQATIKVSGVVETPPQVSLTSPVAGEVLSGTASLQAQAFDDEGITSLDLSLNGEPLATSTDNSTLLYSWNTKGIRDGRYFLSAMATDIKDTFSQASLTFVVDNYPPYAEAGPDQVVKVGEEVTFDAFGSQDVTLLGYSWDFGDGESQPYSGPTSTHVYEYPGTYMVTLTVTDDAGNTDTDTATVVVESTDDIPPTTSIATDPSLPNGLNNWYTSEVTVTLSVSDNEGGSGVARTEYSLDGGNTWNTYTNPFVVNIEGETTILARSTDNVGNIEDPPVSRTISIDKTPPSVSLMVPNPLTAYTGQVTLKATATDTNGVSGLLFSVRKDGIPIGYENLISSYDAASGEWRYVFDTTQLENGKYEVIARATDPAGNIGYAQYNGSVATPFAVYNGMISRLQPIFEEAKAGRTVPVKFTFRIEDMDKFLHDEGLRIEITGAGLSQTSFFGDTARDYRIDYPKQVYITNFRTAKDPATYIVKVFRIFTLADDVLIKEYTFETTW